MPARFIRQCILSCCVLYLYCHPSVCSICMLIHHSPPSAFLQNYILINIHYPHTIFLLFINYIFFKIYFFHLLDYSKKHFNIQFKSYNLYVYVNCNCMWGRDLCRKTTIKSDTRENRWRIKSKLTYHCSFIHQWILACRVLHLYFHPSVCSFCNVVHHGPPSAFQQNYV